MLNKSCLCGVIYYQLNCDIGAINIFSVGIIDGSDLSNAKLTISTLDEIDIDKLLLV